MANGSVQLVLVCMPSANATAAQQAICPKVGTQFYAPTKVQAYLLDPTQQSQMDAALTPFDYGSASALWGVAFTSVVTLYFISHGIGQILGLVRRG